MAVNGCSFLLGPQSDICSLQLFPQISCGSGLARNFSESQEAEFEGQESRKGGQGGGEKAILS